MLLQTNSYIVPKDKRSEHARLLRRFRQVLHRLGCDQFEVYEQVGSNWNTSEPTGRYVQIMKFRDRRHQVAVQTAERSDPSAQALIAEFCQLINFPYQQQQGLFAVGFYNGVVAGVPSRAQGEEAAAAAAAGAGVAWPDAEQGAADEAAQEAAPAAAVQPPETPVAEVPVEAAMETPAASEETLPAATPAATEDIAPVSGETAAAVEEALVPCNEQPAALPPAAVPPPLPVAEAATTAQAGAMDAEELVAMAVESDRPEGQKAVLPPPLPQMHAEPPAGISPDVPPNGEDDLSALLEAHVEPAPGGEGQSDEIVDDLDLSDLEIEPEHSPAAHPDHPRHDHDHVAR